tara:strand:+ start:3650 stop:4003 length:354 start_codon:yes stop_codon:yes gene_type:complete
MPVNSRQQVVFNEVSTQLNTSDWTHDTVLVTWTATMGNGSLLVAANTEAAEAAAATVVKAIDDPSVDDKGYEVGDTVAVNVAVQGNVFNTAALSYSDTDTVVASALTALAAKLNTFK